MKHPLADPASALNPISEDGAQGRCSAAAPHPDAAHGLPADLFISHGEEGSREAAIVSAQETSATFSPSPSARPLQRASSGDVSAGGGRVSEGALVQVLPKTGSRKWAV